MPASRLHSIVDRRNARLDFAELLAAVENASPVAAADVLAERLGDALDAAEVSFLLADFSGRALVRLGHAGSKAAGRTQGRETAESVPLEEARMGAPWRASASRSRTAQAVSACSRR
jgi:hypothetical protein